MRKTLLVLGCLALHLLSACGGDMAEPAKSPAAETSPQSPGVAYHGGFSTAGGEAGGKDTEGKKDERLAMADPAGREPPPPPGAPAPRSAPPTATPGAGDAASVRSPMLVYKAQITMAVFEVNASLARVETIGRDLGGFMAKRDDHSVTIRVPAAAFDEAVKRIESVGDMLHRHVAAEDITEEFRDLEVRLRSARAVQVRLTELLAKAVKVEDSIAIERELDRVTGEIERLEGRAKFLRDQAAFSTLTVRFEPKPTEQVGTGAVRLPVRWLYDLNLPRLLRL